MGDVLVRRDPRRGEVVRLTVEVSVDLDMAIRRHAFDLGLSLWRVWEDAGYRLLERYSKQEGPVDVS